MIDDITKRCGDGTPSFVSDKFRPIGEESVRPHELGGTQVREMMNEATHGNSVPSGVLITPVKNMQTKTLVHVVLSSETDTDVRNKISYDLHMANEHVETIAVPFPGARKFETQLWESAQTIAEIA